MSNFDSFYNNKDEVINFLANEAMWGITIKDNKIRSCAHMECVECKFCEGVECDQHRREWLGIAPLFPVGTPVEVPAFYDSDTTELRYYWGVYHGLHFACKAKSSLGQTLTNGHPICESFDPATIRKVGD